jgi:hypothetical protein
MKKFIAALALLVATGFAVSAQQSGTNDTGNGIWWNGRFGCCPLTPDYLKKTVRVEVLGKLTFISPFELPRDSQYPMPGVFPGISQISANGKTYQLQFPRNLIKQAEKLSGQRAIVSGILNGTTVQITDLKADDTIWLMRGPGPEYVKETTDVESRGQLQAIRLTIGDVFDDPGISVILGWNLIVDGKTYTLELTPEMCKLAVKLEGNEVILNGILDKNTITVNSLKQMVLEFDNLNRPVAS